MHANEFLDATNCVYDECSAGIAKLDKAIVSCHASIAADTRTALVPALYAYWERFFRMSFSEFLRCIGLTTHKLRHVNPSLSRLRLRTELKVRLSTLDQIIDVVNTRDIGGAQQAILDASDTLLAVGQLCDCPIDFVDPEKLILTESNVRYEVIEKNCIRLGLDVAALRKILDESKYQLYMNLKELVDLRNLIAHGESIAAIDQATWEKLKVFTLALMNATQLFLYEALSDDEYLKGAQS